MVVVALKKVSKQMGIMVVVALKEVSKQMGIAC